MRNAHNADSQDAVLCSAAPFAFSVFNIEVNAP